MTMKLPIIRKSQSIFPTKALCPICKQAKVFEPHKFVSLSGGACLMAKSEKDSGPDSKMEGFFNIICHGKEGAKNNYYLVFDIVKDIIGGQFEFYFCSVSCLRKWINDLLDHVEEKEAKASGEGNRP
jgi:hypothetical protein